MTTSKQIEAEAGLSIDWEKAAAEAFVVNSDGSFAVRDDNTVLAPENTHTLHDQIRGPEVRTATTSISISRVDEKIGKPVIHRASVNISSLEKREQEAERVRAEAQAAKEQQAAEAFLKLPAGRRVVALEKKVASLESKISQILAAVQDKPKTTRKAKTDVSEEQL